MRLLRLQNISVSSIYLVQINTFVKHLTVFIILLLTACSSGGNSPQPEPSPTPAPSPSPSNKGVALLSWVAPVAYTDQTKIEKLKGFNLYVSKNREEISSKKVVPIFLSSDRSNTQIEELDLDTYHFSITAVDGNEIEGEMSEIVTKKIDGSQPSQFLNCGTEYTNGSYVITCS